MSSGRGRTESLDLPKLVSSLEYLRTLIVYDSPYVARSLLFYHILPKFSSKNIFIAVYSDTMYRRLVKTYESIQKVSPKIAEILNNVEIIKVGTRGNVSFGNLYKLISGQTWHKSLITITKNLNKDDVLILHGFSIIPHMHDRKGLIEVLKLLDSINEDVTVIGKCSENLYNMKTEKLFERFYDVILRIKRTEGEFLGFGETYMIGVEKSIVVNIKPEFGKFMVGEEGELVKVS